ncbi:hypothetical protein [Streptomyces clavifer]|uniref:hypothetical protein n=1 Tax=Streptomyces clavifer TaxID=68188 RepID=UPI0033B1762D
MKQTRTPGALARFSAGLPLFVVALLLTTGGPVHGSHPPPAVEGCAGIEVPDGYTCEPAPKQCFTTPCPQYALVPQEFSL